MVNTVNKADTPIIKVNKSGISVPRLCLRIFANMATGMVRPFSLAMGVINKNKPSNDGISKISRLRQLK